MELVKKTWRFDGSLDGLTENVDYFDVNGGIFIKALDHPIDLSTVSRYSVFSNEGQEHPQDIDITELDITTYTQGFSCLSSQSGTPIIVTLDNPDPNEITLPIPSGMDMTSTLVLVNILGISPVEVDWMVEDEPIEDDWFKKLFIDEVKPALERHSGGGSSDPNADLALALWVEKSKADNLTCMFGNLKSMTAAPLFDTSKARSFERMFSNCTNLTTVPLYDTSEGRLFGGMFSGCTNLVTVPLFDTSQATVMSDMFNSCINLTTIPLFNTSNVINMNSMFRGCNSLTTVPPFDTRKVSNLSYTFSECANLTTIPLFNTSNVTSIQNMFSGCTNLTTVPMLNILKVTMAGAPFAGCVKLTECWLRNITCNLQVGSGTSYGHLLTVESLLHLIKELRNVRTARTLTIGSANLEKLANTYVKTIDITDEMRAEDAYVGQKLPFVVCESTDEGAMLINEYVLLKQWQLK